MKTMLKDCYPTICNWTDLMNGWDEFMTEESVIERCTDCLKQKTCIEICKLLKQWDTKKAYELI